jgi:hypothetical protein
MFTTFLTIDAILVLVSEQSLINPFSAFKTDSADPI